MIMARLAIAAIFGAIQVTADDTITETTPIAFYHKYKEKIEDTVHVVESNSDQQEWFQRTKFSHKLGADYTFEVWYSHDPANGSWQERKTDSYDKLGVKVTYKGETISWERDF